jgi:hypothetical protein
MAHPMYHHCLRHLNKPVTLHLRDGRSHYGILQGVRPDGVHLRPLPTGVTAEKQSLEVETADRSDSNEQDATQVFFAPFFFPFAALAGLTLGLAAASAFSPFGYGYGYGYRGYW